ncbi:MAG: iron-sulfur cluster assembly scaffold protein [Firmicutes bacterium]|nr:iron-sulfur cluster assembly scaffold protein [Bacillota bacterium]
MYNQKVLEVFESGKNSGIIANASGTGEAGNMACGDIMKIYLKIDKDEKIVDAKFKTFGCVSAIASSSVMCDLVKGKKIDDALKVTNKQVIDELGGLPEIKHHCSVMAQEAFADAINQYRKNK